MSTDAAHIQGPLMALVIFRADASADIGGGHIYRCLTLAHALKQQRAELEIQFICRLHPGNLNHLIEQQGFRVNPIEAEDPRQITTQLVQQIQTHGPLLWLIVDHYQLFVHWHRRFKPLCQQLLIIDDLANKAYDCDLLFDQSLGRKATDYSPWLKQPNCELVCGAEHALLRPEFAQLRPQAQQRRANCNAIKRVLIALSATDPDNITELIIKTLESQPQHMQNWQFDLVLTSSAKHLNRIKQVVTHSSLQLNLHLDVIAMAQLMLAADIAIAAAGTAMLERCSLGLPSVIICLADNQRHIATAMSKRRAAIAVFDKSEITTELCPALSGLQQNFNTYQQLVDNAFGVCHGDGANKLAHKLLTKKPNNPLWLNPVNDSHCQLLFQWQCQPHTRQFARDPNPPTLAQHQVWFAKVVKDSNIHFYLLMQENSPCGYLRLNPIEHDDQTGHEVSIGLSAEHLGQGLGHRGLNLLSQLHRNDNLLAYIEDNNIGSIKAFAKAGYQALGQGWYQLKSNSIET